MCIQDSELYQKWCQMSQKIFNCFLTMHICRLKKLFFLPFQPGRFPVPLFGVILIFILLCVISFLIVFASSSPTLSSLQFYNINFFNENTQEVPYRIKILFLFLFFQALLYSLLLHSTIIVFFSILASLKSSLLFLIFLLLFSTEVDNTSLSFLGFLSV